MKVFLVEEAGPLSTIQDLGRLAYQDYGVPVSGAMDKDALILGNISVGNFPDEAGIEIFGGIFRGIFLEEAFFSVTGATSFATLNGETVKSWKALKANKGDVLEVYSRGFGAWSYLCIRGGVDVPVVLGSKSTYLRGRFGGFEGRPLKKGDVIKRGSRFLCSWPPPDIEIYEELKPSYSFSPTIRVILGPQDYMISEEGIRVFLESTYQVSPRCDRMGMMLEGPKIKHKGGADIISEGTVIGSIQIPGEGLPFVLMADSPTTGGYVKIATVITVDIPVLAQLLPGASLKFEAVSLEIARELNAKRSYKIKKFMERVRLLCM